MTEYPPLDNDPELDIYVRATLGKKAKNLKVLDVRGLTSVADVFIICSGTSSRQVTAMAEHIQITLKKNKIRPLSVEGHREGQWVLMDYGHVLIHLFYEPVRQFYDLEGLWSDAPLVKTRFMNKTETGDGDGKVTYVE